MVVFALKKLISSVHAGVSCYANPGGRGWGDSIQWTGLCNADKESDATGKPIMVIVHKTTCPACIHLKSQFSQQRDIKGLSRKFVMVNATADEVSMHEQETGSSPFYSDGKYVPRIMFYSTAWRQLGLQSSNSEHRFYYSDADDVRKRMETCLQML